MEADVVRGRRLTSWPSIRTDLRSAGAEVADKELVCPPSVPPSSSSSPGRPRLARQRELRPRRLQAATTGSGAYCRASSDMVPTVGAFSGAGRVLPPDAGSPRVFRPWPRWPMPVPGEVPV
ncbi:hypothetical protein [Streptomyces europaeiscabiei]|uniref:hypothetical protein n=1 Tax=Streptomyces europaeiscabiei TaxID=146819 RepID=UPI0029CA57B3|nr:hypothetical protein [Streptomyces europaeiscabiei]